MRINEKRQGSITLETSIVLPIFIFIILFVIGLLQVVVAQNIISHALVQSTKSLSMDSYLTENVESAAEAGTKFWGGLSDMVLDLYRLNCDEYFSSQTDWYKSSTGNASVAKKRFIGYFANGSESNAKELAKQLGIINGLDGIVFEMSIAEEDVIVTISYQIQIWFDMWDLGKIPIKQSITSRLWM